MTKEPSRAFFVLSLISFYLFGLSFAVAFLFAVPVFDAMFRDFGATLPAPTRFCIRASSFVRSGFILFGPLFGGALVAAFFAIEKRKKERKALLLFPASAGLAIFLLVVAMFLPIFYK
ncbi:MAG: hypothetical protein ABSG50_14905 [Opitutaceae bacterium]|jgi:type IV pilus assembly protein PilC